MLYKLSYITPYNEQLEEIYLYNTEIILYKVKNYDAAMNNILLNIISGLYMSV